ncbi:MAG: hypothetical protein PHI37_00550 [Candidatus Gracilibacteria bacterium]|nr:hypothetical protein [Candidatus Gracilibacteria bacterium]
MGNTKYSRANLFQFIQITLRQNKSNNKYFDLVNDDKLFIEINTFDGSIYAYLIKSSVGVKPMNSDLLLYNSKVWDIKSIGDFCNNIEVLLQRLNIRKLNLLDELGEFGEFDNSSIDFDKI